MLHSQLRLWCNYIFFQHNLTFLDNVLVVNIAKQAKVAAETKATESSNAKKRPPPIRTQSYSPSTKLATPQVARPTPLRTTFSVPPGFQARAPSTRPNAMRVISSGQAGLFHVQKDSYFPSATDSKDELDQSKLDAEFEEFELRMRYMERQMQQLMAESSDLWYSWKTTEQEHGCVGEQTGTTRQK